jgi:uncharacterized protein (DUF2267 family)
MPGKVPSLVRHTSKEGIEDLKHVLPKEIRELWF